MPSLLAIAILFLTLLLLWSLIFRNGRDHPRLPPGPWPLPIVGNIHMLGRLPHRTLAKLAQKYGPIMHLRLGLVPTIVVSSAEAAELFLRKHDLIFASRPPTQAAKYLWHGAKAIGFTPYGDYWRNARKMCTLHLLTTTKVGSFEWLRRKEVERTVSLLKEASKLHEKVDVGKVILELTENIIFKIMVGKGKEEDKENDLKHVIDQVMTLAGAFNMADFVPFLAPLDLQGLTGKMKQVSKKLDEILGNIINDHLKERNFEHNNDLLSAMLAVMEDPNEKLSSSFGIDNIKAILLDLFNAGIDTVGHTVEWAMTLLLKEPRVMKLLQAELDRIVGKSRMVQESDLPRLPYLDMVVKETLRLYPGGPLLLPRESMEDIVINGYMIPKKSRVIINFWAIGRGLKEWSANADEFYPERFADSDIDGWGQHFEYIPFGAGRRKCPGIQLGTVTVKIILSQLVHCFEWELPNGMQPQDIDMTENFGIAIPRANELIAKPSYRLLV